MTSLVTATPVSIGHEAGDRDNSVGEERPSPVPLAGVVESPVVCRRHE